MSKSCWIFLLLSLRSFADVQSIKGVLDFDVQANGGFEMRLNSTGLGIGTAPTKNLHVDGNAIISDQLFVGGSGGSANLNLNGTLGYGFELVTTNVSLVIDHALTIADSSSDNLILKLPYAGDAMGQIFTVKKISAENKVWVVASNGNLIDEKRSVELSGSALPFCEFISNGVQWYILTFSDNVVETASDNLIAWWKMDEIVNDNLIDEVGLYPTLYMRKSGVVGSDPTITKGNFDGAIALDGTGDNFYANTSNAAIPYIDNATQLSISIWAKVDDLDSNGALFSKGNSDTLNAFLLFRDDVGSDTGRTETYKVIISDGTNSVRLEAATNASSDSNWHHLVVTFRANSSNGLRLYIDGVEDTFSPVSTTSILSLDSNANYFRFGRTDNGFDLNGALDEARVYNRVLTPAEVQALYQIGP